MEVNDNMLVRRERNHIVLLIYPGADYPIEYVRMNTPEKLLGWIFHLCKKGNVTKEHIQALIEAAKDMGVKVDFHA